MGISQAEFEYNENYSGVKINHPDYYNLPDKKECIEQMIEDYGKQITAIFCLTNAYKYIYRNGHKTGDNADIEKARWYFDFVNERLYSAVSGKKVIKLYLDVKKELKHD